MEADTELEYYNRAIYFRGLFITRYSGIEFALCELLARLRSHPAYSALGDLPYKFTSKIKRIRDICAMQGPLAQYSAQLLIFVGEFEKFESCRHFFAHGIMNSTSIEDKPGVTFSMYDHRPVPGYNGAVLHGGQFQLSLDDMDRYCGYIQPISTEFTALVARICRECSLGSGW